MACSGLAAQVEGSAQALRSQTLSTPSKRCGQIGQTFSEHLAATPAHPADKPADAHMQDDAVVATRQISQRPLVLRVSAFGPPSTHRTPRPAAHQTDLQMDRGSGAPEAVDMHSSTLRKQQLGQQHGPGLSLRAIDAQTASLTLLSAHRECLRTL
jgi:hypothetical protein